MNSEFGGISRYLLPVTIQQIGFVKPIVSQASVREPQCADALMPPNGAEMVTKSKTLLETPVSSLLSFTKARRATKPPWL